MPQQYDPTPLEGRTFSVTGTASGQALAFVIQPAKLAELATLKVGSG